MYTRLIGCLINGTKPCSWPGGKAHSPLAFFPERLSSNVLSWVSRSGLQVTAPVCSSPSLTKAGRLEKQRRQRQ